MEHSEQWCTTCGQRRHAALDNEIRGRPHVI